MNIKRGLNRITLVIVILAMLAAFPVGVKEQLTFTPYPAIWKLIVGGMLSSILAFLVVFFGINLAFWVVFFGIKGTARLFIWIVAGFKGGKKWLETVVYEIWNNQVTRGLTMRERLLDVVKWGLILLVAGIIFYVVCPKYDFKEVRGMGKVFMFSRHNTITGQIDLMIRDPKKKEWKNIKDIKSK